MNGKTLFIADVGEVVVLICVGKVTKNIQIMAHFGHKKRLTALMMLSVLS